MRCWWLCCCGVGRFSWYCLFVTMYFSRLLCHTFLLVHIVLSRPHWPNPYLWVTWYV